MKKILSLTTLTLAFASAGLFADTPAPATPPTATTPAMPAQLKSSDQASGHKKHGKKNRHHHKKPKEKTNDQK